MTKTPWYLNANLTVDLAPGSNDVATINSTEKQYPLATIHASTGNPISSWNTSIQEALYYGKLMENSPQLLDYLTAFLSSNLYPMVVVEDVVAAEQTAINMLKACSQLLEARNNVLYRTDKFIVGATVTVSKKSVGEWLILNDSIPMAQGLVGPIKVMSITNLQESEFLVNHHTQELTILDGNGNVSQYSGYWFNAIPDNQIN